MIWKIAEFRQPMKYGMQLIKYKEHKIQYYFRQMIIGGNNMAEEHGVICNCYEIGLLGDAQQYEGSALQYLMRLKTDFPDKSIQIADAYLN